MLHIVTRQDEEVQTLKRFVENLGEKFDPKLIDYSKGEPCDVSYKEIQYQITEGDQDQLAKKRKQIDKEGRYLIVRSISEANNPKEIIERALEKKVYKSNNDIILLIDCISSGNYSLQEREQSFKNYFSENRKLSGSWQNIYIVFSSYNIQLC